LLSITAEIVRKLLDYDPDTGALTWRARSIDMFSNGKYGRARSRSAWNARWAGAVAGRPNTWGHLQIGIYGRRYLSHRLAWLWMTGEWPTNTVDHKDMDPSNNRWENLRLATMSQQNMNQRPGKNNTSGVRGVSYNRLRDKHLVQIRAGGKRVFLKEFDNFIEAVESANAARAEAHGEFAHVGKLNWNAPQSKEVVIDPWQ
jgi:hypothetical protein